MHNSYSVCFRYRTCSSTELWIVKETQMPILKNFWEYRLPPHRMHLDFSGCCLCLHTDNYVLFLKSVGGFRFAPPEPPLKFTGVRQTTRFGAACPQQAMDISFIPGLGSRNASVPASSEDCRTVIYAYYLILF